MAISIQIGFLDIPKSITNPNVNDKDALDRDNPLSFLNFIKLINVSFEPDTLQTYYNYYLNEWNNINSSTTIDNNALIVERYRDFIKEISINYTTPEEKKFLSLIDFNDPLDLDIAIGFYGRKLKELSDYYNKKRQDIKFNLTRSNLRGTVFGTERSIYELTLSYLKNYDDGKMLYDYSEIQRKIEIEIEELYDTYPLYFNQTPDSKIYDKKDLDYGYDIFLRSNKDLIDEIFSSVSDELKSLKEVNDLFDNRRSLTEKYVTTDFYYLSTGATVTDILSGRLFESKFPSINFKNNDYPTTATTEVEGYLKTDREVGFFKPCKNSIVLVEGGNDTYSINLSNLKPNSLYYFPDPNIFGKNGDILTFIVDDSHLKRNFSSGDASGQPSTSPDDTKYFGYSSKTPPVKDKYLDNIFESGYIKDIKSDIYGNVFGLFNNFNSFNGYRYSKNIQYLDAPDTYSMVINGYQFYDDLYGEGFFFDYTTFDDTTFTETTRSGLSTNTGSFIGNDPEYTISFGRFSPYTELSSPTEENLVTTYKVLENAFIMKSDTEFYDDAISSDLSAFETDTGSFYFTKLIEGGIYTYDPLVRGLLDPTYPSISSTFTQYPTVSSINTLDGGWIGNDTTRISLVNNDYEYLGYSDNSSEYVLSASPYSEDFNGNIYVKNSVYRNTKGLIEALPYLENKYSQNVVTELSSLVVNFEIANDVLFIETPNYLTINKIVMKDGVFEDPKTGGITVQHSSTPFESLTNRFKYNNEVFYSKLMTLFDSPSSNNFIIYPEIYKTDLINFKNTKIFPISNSDITDFFNISGDNVRNVKCSSSTITYNSKNNLFNISFLLKDQNDMPTLHELDFEKKSDITFTNHNIIRFRSDSYSNILSSIGTITPLLSSTSLVFDNEELVL